MRTIIVLILGVLIGLAAAAAVLLTSGADLLLDEHASPVGVDQTVARIEAAAKKEGWVVVGVKKIDESIRKHGAGEVLPVRVISVCHPQLAARILKDDANRVVSVMMPCRIAVYAKGDGKAYVSTMNAGLVGRLFGGTIADVMAGEVTEAQQRFVDAVMAAP